ncbi:DegT/DnrJ/EryC1/StrS family aminotransferase [Methylophaga thiooxydans]|uniref:DegT/DnrJ/EryC1/StrS family aminotransferase n=1 Tax=Methylophaga thiooxydans TaxID=392484 RepID=UPI002352630E|nr:DegT/DnrJ/EryC1/StrS family aminotransferase [Methylophaga thiooxydans]
MKNIQSKADLAINGAPPAFDEPLHVGRPNVGEKAEFLKHVDDIFESKWLSNNGPKVQILEQRVADYHSVKHCVAMSNGTIALEIAIRALELEGEVIIPSYTFIATAHALSWQGITPIFADIDPDTHCLDPDSVRKMISPNSTGIIGVHLWGQTAPVDELQKIADQHNLKVMFDAAHAFGCSYKGQMIGNFGEAEVLSFHATKLFNTFEGGAVLTNNDALAEKMRLMRNFGFSGLDNVIYSGTNGKMTEICAAMGLVNLASLDAVIEHNRLNYLAYQNGLAELSGVTLLPFDERETNNYQYVVIEVDETCSVDRDVLSEVLQAENIIVRKYFWPGCHNMLPYRQLYPNASAMLERTVKTSEQVLVLPSGTAMNAESINTVIKIIEVSLK